MKPALLLLLVFHNVSAFAQGFGSNSEVNFSTRNYTVQYPSSWLLDTSRAMRTEFFIFSALQNTADQFRENINLTIQDMGTQKIDLPQYKKITESQISQTGLEGKLFESIILHSQKGDCYKVMYAMTQGKLRLQITSLCYISGSKAYLITFTAETTQYEQYKLTGNDILNSFTLKK